MASLSCRRQIGNADRNPPRRPSNDEWDATRFLFGTSLQHADVQLMTYHRLICQRCISHFGSCADHAVITFGWSPRCRSRLTWHVMGVCSRGSDMASGALSARQAGEQDYQPLSANLETGVLTRRVLRHPKNDQVRPTYLSNLRSTGPFSGFPESAGAPRPQGRLAGASRART